jgi:hypothetical protein
MRYLSIFTHPRKNSGPDPELIAKMGALIDEGTKAGWLIGTEGVPAGKEGIRVKSAHGEITVTDGPFPETKEVIGGYAVLEAPSRAAVLELTRRFLGIAGDGTCTIYELFVQPQH